MCCLCRDDVTHLSLAHIELQGSVRFLRHHQPAAEHDARVLAPHSRLQHPDDRHAQQEHPRLGQWAAVKVKPAS